MTALKVDALVLEVMLEAATDDGSDAWIEMGDPERDVLMVGGRVEAWSEK